PAAPGWQTCCTAWPGTGWERGSQSSAAVSWSWCARCSLRWRCPPSGNTVRLGDQALSAGCASLFRRTAQLPDAQVLPNCNPGWAAKVNSDPAHFSAMANETTVDDDVAERAEAPGLKRVMGPKLLLFFVVGDILGTTIYSLTGKVAGKVGGALWIPFLVAFVVAFLTAVSYLELVGKYPKAGGAPLYVHRAFGVHFVTFLIAFTVMCSGLTSAASAAQAFSGDYLAAIVGDIPSWPVAIAFVLLLAAVNLRGVAESVEMKVVLTCIELLGLVIVIVLGVWAIFGGNTDPELAPDPSRLTEFNTDTTPLLAVTSATALAFFAMVGFEDSVNMAEETKNPAKNFP